MARVLVFTDRAPADTDGKGGIAWRWILALAESQHQVLVLTTQSLDKIDVAHPRLSVGRPAPSFGLQYLPKFLQGVMVFRPEVIHTFALKRSNAWSALTIWTYLHGACRALPALRRYSAFFEADDLSEKSPELAWHQGSNASVVFTPAQRLALQRYGLTSEVVPMELDALEPREDGGYVFVPAPIDRWSEGGIEKLAEFLRANPDKSVRISGGWGELAPARRREGWQTLLSVSDRVSLLDPLSFEDLRAQTASAESVWLEGLEVDSWHHVLGTYLSRMASRPLHGAPSRLELGSTANFLSRLYAHP